MTDQTNMRTVTYDQTKWRLVPAEPDAGIMAAAATAVWPTASAADLKLAREAAQIVLLSMAAMPGVTLDMLAATIATMAPAYRAMLAAAPTHPDTGAGDAITDTDRLDWILRHTTGDALRYSVGVLADTADLSEFRAAIDAMRAIDAAPQAPAEGEES